MRYEINMEILNRLCDIVMAFDDEIRIKIMADKWTICVTDPANVAMADIGIPATEFIEYDIPDGNNGPVEIGADIPKLAAFLKVFPARQRKNTSVTIEYDTDTGRFTYAAGHVTRSGDNLDTKKITDPKVPTYTWPIEFDTTVESILSAVRASKDVSDVLLFTSDDDGNFRIIAKNDVDTEKYDFPDSPVINTDHGSTQFSSMHSRDYLYDMLKHLKKGNITISGGTDTLIKIEYGDPAKLGFDLTMLLDPRIEGDDDKPEPEPEEVQDQPDPEPEPELKEGKLKLSDIPDLVKKIMPEHQQKVIVGSLEHWGILKDLEERANEVPKLYTQEDKGKDEVMVMLHYFTGGSDWFITEWDGKDTYFGYAILNQDYQMSELGYMSRTELTETPPVELDFFWEKKTLQAALEKVDSEYFGVKETEPDDDGNEGHNDKEMIRNVNTGETLELIKKGHSGYWVRKPDGTEDFWRFEYCDIEAGA